MSLNHRDGGSSSRSGSRKNRKLGERVTPREEPVSGYQETPGPERGARFSGGQWLRQAGEDGLRARRCLRDATGLGSSSRGPAPGRGRASRGAHGGGGTGPLPSPSVYSWGGG